MPFDGNRCYVHSRGVLLESGFGLITTQKLELSGCDVFYGIEMMKSHDGGESWSSPVLCKHLRRTVSPDGTSAAICDGTPFYHRKSGKIILTGHTVLYGADNALLAPPRPRHTFYAVYNEAAGDFAPYRLIEMPETAERTYFSAGAGCAQILETESGELLIPFYYNAYAGACAPETSCTSVSVMRCAFDGEQMRLIEVGSSITVNVPRGLGEPSLAKLGERYLLTLRNDESGFIAESRDGLHFSEPRPLCFEDGENIGNYNTQQHWLIGGGRAYLVYTRRAETNGHVFRHRAPLFIAELDPERLCLLRQTEQIAVPERGARLGNFGCQSYSSEVGYVFASEWMQCGREGWQRCAERGSDGSLFISRVIY